MTNFYVYGLLDPRTSSIFYIGKGKGKRIFQHEMEKEDIHSNIGKLKIIKEIKNVKQDVGHLIIAKNLNEDSAFLLEKILIYRLGRSIFDEGCLTNIVPGGRWHKNDSLFIKNEEIPTINYLKKNYPELISILKNYPQVSKKFKGLQCPNYSNDENIYVYDESGINNEAWTVDYFIDVFGLSKALELINVLKTTTSPVYAWYRIWRKCQSKFFENISQIPFQDFDIIDFDFVKKINKVLLNKETASIECFYPNNKKQAEISISQNPLRLSLSCYYDNGNKKHITHQIDNLLDGKCFSWHINGQLREEIEYKLNICICNTQFFDTGIKKSYVTHSKDGRIKLFKMWYDNRQLHYEKNHINGSSFGYTENGTLISKGIRLGKTDNDGIILLEYKKDGKLKKETKRFYVDGLLHGYEKSFYGTGEIRRFVDYTNGHNKKIITTYKKNGEISTKK